MAKRRGRRGTEVPEEDQKRITRESFREMLAIFSFIKPYRWQFILGFLFLTLSTGSTFLFLNYLKELIDPAVDQVENYSEVLGNVALVLAGILVFQAGFSFMRIYLFARVSERSLADLRHALYRKLISLWLPFFEERRVGELNSRITADVEQLQTAFGVTIAEFLRQILTFFGGIIVLLFISTKLTLVMLSTFPPAIVGAIFLGRYIREKSKKAQDSLASANVVVEETLQAIPIVKAFTNEWYESSRYQNGLKDVVKYALQAANARGAFVVFLITAVFGGITVTIWYGATQIAAGSITIGDLVYFVMITLFVGGSIAGLGDLYGQLQKMIGASERIRQILTETSELELPEGPVEPVDSIQGNISFDQVAFAYPTRPDITVLKNVSLDISSDTKVALVGHSGAGKSTITQLILRYYELNSGVISIDGKNLADYNLSDLRSQIGVVPQEVVLFGGSIRDNIAYGRPNATEEEILEAAKQANAWEFISGFPEKLDTLVGDRGIKLSGGQRQRIAIARAILKDPAILILDEATSSLDAESEHLVQEALNQLMEGRTTIIIAHRLSTIRQVDQIYVIEDGHIVEAGTHVELAAQRGVYRKLLDLQFAR